MCVGWGWRSAACGQADCGSSAVLYADWHGEVAAAERAAKGGNDDAVAAGCPLIDLPHPHLGGSGRTLVRQVESRGQIVDNQGLQGGPVASGSRQPGNHHTLGGCSRQARVAHV